MTILRDRECKKAHKYYDKRKHLCAVGRDDPPQHMDNFDLGSALVIEYKGTMIAVGIASYTAPEKKTLMIFTRILSFVPWIKSKVD